jgi:caffeoyl-CoA O-methyltransferase
MTTIEVVDPRIQDYALEHVTPLRPELADLAAETERETPFPVMMSGLMELRFLEALVVAGGAKRVLEVGTFTGLGALALAAVVGDGGQVLTIENDERFAAIARKHFDRSPDKGKIELLIGDARELVTEVEGPFDLIYLDAWKTDYEHYYEVLLPKLAPAGVIAADNVLWRGQVVEPASGDGQSEALAAFNDHVQADARVTNTLLTLGDGIMLIRHAV